MSRMGKRPVAIPAGVTVTIEEHAVRVKGKAAELSHPILPGTTVTVEGAEVKVTAEKLTRNPMFGTMRAQVANMVTGVTTASRRRWKSSVRVTVHSWTGSGSSCSSGT